MKGQKLRKILFGLLLSFSFFGGGIFISCGDDAGLGESVDTAAPTIEITYPPLNSSIMGEFLLAGKCEDDKKIQKVEVTLKKLESKAVVIGTYQADLLDDNAWEIWLNQEIGNIEEGYNGWTLADGKYAVDVIAYDNAGHKSGSSSLEFQIDNTAPFFVLSNPAVIKSKNVFTQYGSVLSVEGTIVDDLSVDTMDVTVYTKDGKVFGPYTEKDISTAGGTNVQIARYMNGGTLDINKRYEEIYDVKGPHYGQTEEYYLSVTLKDSAKIYANKNDLGEAKGNSTSSFYLYDDIYENLVSPKVGKGIDYKILKSVINKTSGATVVGTNGTYNADEIRSVLKENLRDSTIEDNKPSFSLNPAANPTYAVSGFDYEFDANFKPQNASSGAALTITASMGLDGVKISPETFKVWIVESEKALSEAELSTKIQELEKLSTAAMYQKDENDELKTCLDFSDKVINDIKEKTGFVLLYDFKDYKEGSQSNVTKSIVLDSDILSVIQGYHYYVAVTGNDKDRVPFSQRNYYGFFGTAAGTPPSISLTSPKNLSYEGSSAITYTGTVKDNGTPLKTLTIELSVQDETTGETLDKTLTETITYDNSTRKWSSSNSLTVDGSNVWTFIPENCPTYSDIAAGKGVSYLYTIKGVVTSTSGQATEIERNVRVDTTDPVISISQLTPTIDGLDFYKSEDKAFTYVNGEITFKASIEETNLKSVSYEVFIGDNDAPVYSSGDLGKKFTLTQTINTKEYTDNSKIEIVITAQDIVGNETTYSSNTYNSEQFNREESIVINQETDKPQISLSNADTSITEEANVKLGTNLFGVDSNNTLSVNFTDDDTLKSVTIEVKDLQGNSIDSYTNNSIKSSTYSYSYKLPKDEGAYKVYINATDFDNVTKVLDPFVVAVDSGVPTINVINPVLNSYQTSIISASGTVSKTNGITITAKVYRKADKENAIVTQTVPENQITDKNWTQTIDLSAHGANNYVLEYEVKDKYEQSSKVSTDFIVDNVPPTFEFTNLDIESVTESTDFNRYTNNTSYTIKLLIEDSATPNNMDNIYYYLGDTEPEKVDNHYAPFDSNGGLKSGWSIVAPIADTTQKPYTVWTSIATIDISKCETTDGTKPYTVYIVARDAAGNYSTVEDNDSNKLKIYPDRTAPSVSELTASPEEVNSATKENIENGTTKFTISVEITDATVVESIELYDGNTKLNIEPVKNANTYTFTVPKENITTGSHVYKISAKDKAGNVNEVTKSMSFDATNPTVNISGVSPLVKVDGVDKVNGKIKITGTATDETNLLDVDGLEWNVNGSNEEGLFGSVNVAGTFTNWEFEIDTSKLTDNTTHTINVIVKDKAQNSVKATKEISVNQNSDAPVLNLTNVNSSVDAIASITDGKTNIFGISSNNKITGSITDDDGIKEVKVTYTKEGGTPQEKKLVSNGTSTSYTLDYELPKEEAGYTVAISVTDTKGETVHSTKSVNFAVAVDESAPEFINVTPSDGNYYSSTFNVEGTVKDSSNKVELQVTSENNGTSTNYATKTPITLEAGSKQFTDTITISSLVDNVSEGYTLTYTATDRWGKTATKSIKYKKDSEAPKLSNTDSGVANIKGASGVGQAWFKDSALTLTGYYTDTNGSGISSINYTLKPYGSEENNWKTGETTANAGKYTINGNSDTDGYRYSFTVSGFEACSAGEPYTLELYATDKAGNKSTTQSYSIKIDKDVPNFASGYYTFAQTPNLNSANGTASGTVLANGKNDITLYGTVSDSASGLDSVKFLLGSVEIPADVTYTTEQTLNSWENYVGASYNAYNSANATSYTGWKAVIAKAQIANGGTLYATVKDTASNETKQQVLTITIDNDSPRVKISTTSNSYLQAQSVVVDGNSDTTGNKTSLEEISTKPGTGAILSINKNAIFSGTATDDYNIASIKLYYSTTDSSTDYDSDTPIGELKDKDAYSWSFEQVVTDGITMLDGQKYTGTPQTAYFKIVATDTAANESVYVYKYSVDPNADRPEINVTSMANNEGILKYETKLEGTINDDDGIDENCVLKVYEVFAGKGEDGENYSQTTPPTTSDAWASYTQTSELNFNKTSGDWSYTPLSKEDSQKTLYIYFKDAKGTEFWTAYAEGSRSEAQNLVNMPKVQFKRSEDANYSPKNPLVYKTDGNSPVVENIKINYSATSGSGYLADPVLPNDVYGGVTRKYAKFYITVKDNSGIKEMSATIAGEDITFESKPTSTDGTSVTWVSREIDLSEFTSGNTEVKAIVYDNSDMYSNGTATIYVDNEVNVENFRISSPVITNNISSEVLTSDITMNGAADDGSGIGLASIKWAVPQKDETVPSETTEWIDSRVATSTVSAWSFKLDGTEGNCPLLKDFCNLTEYEVSKDGAVYKVPVWFRLEDQLGNIAYINNNTIQYNPNLDWPTAKIIYPTGTIVDNKATTTVGGTVRLTGSGIDAQTTVKKVFVQISTETDANGTPVWTKQNFGSLTAVSVTENKVNNFDVKGFAGNNTEGYDVDRDGWGFVAEGDVSWHLEINNAGEFDNLGEGKYVYIRAAAIDDSGNMGLWSNYETIAFDAGVPTIGKDANIAIFDNEANIGTNSENTTAYATYVADKYITNKNGQWYLVVSASDDSGIKKFVVKESIGGNTATELYSYSAGSSAESGSIGTVVNGGKVIFVQKDYGRSGDAKHFDKLIYIPIDTQSDGYRTYTVTAYEGAEESKFSSGTYTFNVDTTVPTLNELTSNDTRITASKSVAGNKLVNSNSNCVTFGSTVDDEGSGFEKLAFYLKKNGSIYNPYPTGSESGWTKQNVTESQISSLVSEDGLYGKSILGTINENANSFVASSSLDTTNVRAGGLAKINGTYYIIKAVEGDTVKVHVPTGAITSKGDGKDTVFFPYALVVQYNTAWTNKESYENKSSYATDGYTIAEDDNDGILETVSKSGTTWTWDVSIASDTITDGVYDIVVVAFDAAGNCAKTETTTMISNNMPRLSKVYLATDLNFNGAYSDNEYGISRVDAAGEEQVEYGYSALTNGVSTQVVELDTTYQYLDSASKEKKGTFAVKKGLSVVTEFVSGGNTDIYALPKLFAETTSESDRSKANKGTNGNVNSEDKMNEFTPSANIGGTNLKEYTLTNESIPGLLGYTAGMENSSSTFIKSYLQLTLWDTVNITDESTVATEDVMNGDLIETYGNQYTILNIPFIMDIEDDVNPTSSIDDLTENSVYTVTEDDVTKTLGHIEPSDTLSTSIFINGTGLFDKDDKVSGQIVYTGKVTDNTYIKTLSVTATGTNATLFNNTEVATYTNGQLEFDSDYGPDNYATKGWYIQKEKETFTQATGHTVEWKLVVDTSTVKNGENKVYAAKDVTFTVDVDDGNTIALTGTDSNRMDIVPYITGILRTSTTKSNIARTHRSTYGEYPVAIGDTLTVTGYNLSTLSTGLTVKVGATQVTPKEATTGTEFKIDVPTNSGELVVTVNGDVETLNHQNNNSLKTNRDISDEKLYDNRYLRVWDVDHYFKESTNANMPTMVTDNQGNLFSSWTDMGSATVQLERGLSNSSSPVYVCYDQTDKESWLSVDKSTLNGDLSVMYFPANVGWSGTPDTTGYAQAAAIGGVWGAGIPNAANIDYGNFADPVNNNGKRKYVRLPGNPLIKIDSKIEVAGWQLYSHSMRRDVSQFTNAKTVRKDKDMHFAYYDTKNKALRYTYQPVVDGLGETGWNDESRLRTISGWILIDGTFDGQDRLHTPGTYDIINANDSTNDIYSEVNETSVVLKTANWNLPNTCTVGIAYTDSKGKYRLDLHEATVGNNKRTLTFNDGTTHNTSYTCMGGAVYYGDSNVVTSGASRVSSAGSYLSLDVTSSGKPVIVYYDSDNETLRIAYSTSATPSMTNVATGRDTFTRQTISDVKGGTYVQAKIDPQNYLHIMYRDSDGQLCYIKSTNTPDDGAYTFGKSMVIETSGTYGTLSLMKDGTDYVPCVAFLNSEGTANGVKYSLLRDVDTGLRDEDTGDAILEKLWDTMVVPAVVSGGENHYITGGELVYVEGKSGLWDVENDGVDTAECDAIVGFNTGRMDVVFLKSEK